MRATAILGTGSFGHLWVYDDDAPLWIETEQNHAGNREEVELKLNAELNTYKNGQTEITVGIDTPEGDPVWGEDLDVGDEVFVDGAWREIVAYAVSIDDETGRKTIVPQFGVVLDEPEERIARTFRAIGGLNGGTSHLARPDESAPKPNVRPP